MGGSLLGQLTQLKSNGAKVNITGGDDLAANIIGGLSLTRRVENDRRSFPPFMLGLDALAENGCVDADGRVEKALPFSTLQAVRIAHEHLNARAQPALGGIVVLSAA